MAHIFTFCRNERRTVKFERFMNTCSVAQVATCGTEHILMHIYGVALTFFGRHKLPG